MTTAPVVQTAISLTQSTFRFSDEDSAKPSLVAESTLITPSVLTVDSRGERDAGTILGTSISDFELEFRAENFAFYDLSNSEPVVCDPYPGSCDPTDHFLELRASEPRVTRTLLGKNHPFSDPVYLLKPGHTYRLTLKPQTIKCWTSGVDKVLARREIVPPGEGMESPTGFEQYRYPGALEVRLSCDDVLVLKVEE